MVYGSLNKYKLKYHESRGLWLELLGPEETFGLSFNEGKTLIIDTYKAAIDGWKHVSEEEFLKSGDIVRKLQNSADEVTIA